MRVRPVERHLDSFPQLPGRHLHVGVATHPGESCNAHMCANANEDFKLRSSTVKVNCHRVPPFWDVIEAKRRTTLKIRYLSIYQTRTIHFVSQSSLAQIFLGEPLEVESLSPTFSSFSGDFFYFIEGKGNIKDN